MEDGRKRRATSREFEDTKKPKMLPRFPDIFYRSVARIIAESSHRVIAEMSLGAGETVVLTLTWKTGLPAEAIEKLRQDMFQLSSVLLDTVNVTFQPDKIIFETN